MKLIDFRERVQVQDREKEYVQRKNQKTLGKENVSGERIKGLQGNSMSPERIKGLQGKSKCPKKESKDFRERVNVPRENKQTLGKQ